MKLLKKAIIKSLPVMAGYVVLGTGSVIGSLIGAMVKFNSAGIEFSMTAFFVTVVVEQWLTNKEHRPVVLGALVSTICYMALVQFLF